MSSSISVDSAVSALVDSIGEAQRKHRLITMRYSEVENKLALSSADHRTLNDRKKAIMDKEMQLKADLENLTTEHHNLQLLLMTETDRYQHCEMEEPLLAQHVNEKIAVVEAKVSEWNLKIQQLENLSSIMEKDVTTRSLKEELKTLEQSSRDLEESKKELEDQLDNVKRKIRHEKDAQQKRQNPLLSDAFVAFDDDTLEGLTETGSESFEMEWYHTLSQHCRKLRSIEREKEDLHHRCYELSRWYEEMSNSKTRFETSSALLRRCVEAHLCAECITS